MPKIILTGPPGAGKTTILDLLEEMGFAVVQEVARDIIASETAKGEEDPDYVPVLPATDQERFNQLVVEEQLRREASVVQRPAILDRSLIDPLAYAEVFDAKHYPGAQELIDEAGYHKVLFLEPLASYVNDPERFEDADLAKRIHEQLDSVYGRFGIETISVPPLPIQERLLFVLDHIPQERV